MPTNVVIIACSIFRFELESLQRIGKLTVPIVYLNSMLHMRPNELQLQLDAKLEEYKDFKIILLYGDCHARMLDYEKNPHVLRTPGINCCEILLGTNEYRRLRKEGAFILLPEWTDRWKEVFIDYMGFKNAPLATSFMGEMHKKLVFVDTGMQKKNDRLFEEISKYLGLHLEVCTTSTEELEKTLTQIMNESMNKTDGE